MNNYLAVKMRMLEVFVATEVRSQSCLHLSPMLELPSPFCVVTLREVGNAFAHAKIVAAERGAGTDNGDLLVLRSGQQEPARPSLAKRLTEPTWLDPTTGGPYR